MNSIYSRSPARAAIQLNCPGYEMWTGLRPIQTGCCPQASRVGGEVSLQHIVRLPSRASAATCSV